MVSVFMRSLSIGLSMHVLIVHIQWEVASRLVRRGAGLVVNSNALSSQGVAFATDQLIRNQTYANACACIRCRV